MQKILFIEDDFSHIAIYKTKFELEGFSFDSAKTNQETKDKIAINKPDLILLDLLLIGENGINILARLKEDEKTKDIPVIVFTNYPKLEYKEEAMRLGAIDFIVKTDVTPEQMTQKVKNILFQLHKNHNQHP